MKRREKKDMNRLFITGVFLAVPAFLFGSPKTGPGSATRGPQSLEDRVRHELIMQPYYNVFDNLSFHVDSGVVTLTGEVVDPVLKDDAGKSVKHLEGVTEVKNEIEVLPLSPFDNQIRWRTYRAVFGYGPLQRYALGAVPSIHLIVKNGHVTLEGVVGTEMDKELAYVRANQVPGVFAVTNNLRVE